jgi:hypothetical protein
VLAGVNAKLDKEIFLGSYLKFIFFIVINVGFSSAVVADRYGVRDSMEGYPSAPLWYAVYFVAGLFLLVGKNSPLKAWANRNAGFALLLFLGIFLVLTTLIPMT